jgi:hypothetical protein
MPTFKIKVKEICEKVVETEAETLAEAYENVEKAYGAGVILMDPYDGATCSVEYIRQA